MYRKCQNTCQESRAPFQNMAVLRGHEGGLVENNITALHCTVVPLKVPPLFALCCAKIFGLNQPYCSVEMQLWEALSCLFIEQAVKSPPPLLCCMLGSVQPNALVIPIILI